MAETAYIPRLRTQYEDSIKADLMKQFGFGNQLEVPRLMKVTLNMGLGEAVQTPKIIEAAVEEMSAIVGQKPVVIALDDDARPATANGGQRVVQRIECAGTLLLGHVVGRDDGGADGASRLPRREQPLGARSRRRSTGADRDARSRPQDDDRLERERHAPRPPRAYRPR